MISRALVELFASEPVVRAVAFRGGTALHKLFLAQPGRYSEDIDLVQTEPGAIGGALDAIRACLDPWLGEPKRDQSRGTATLLYRFETTSLPVQRVRLKVEINTREHFTALGYARKDFAVENPWFTGSAQIVTYAIEELLGTKLRALYQRRKGRDLFDLWLALTSCAVDEDKIVGCFAQYLERDGTRIPRADFEANLDAKLRSPAFVEDTAPLLPTGIRYDAAEAAALVSGRLLARLDRGPRAGGRRPRTRKSGTV